jgi:hypothetical protein
MKDRLKRIQSEIKDYATEEKEELLRSVQESIARDKTEADFLNTIDDNLKQLGASHFSKLWRQFMNYEEAAYSDDKISPEIKSEMREREWEKFVEMRGNLLQEFKAAGGNEQQHLAVLKDAEKRSPARCPFHSIII